MDALLTVAVSFAAAYAAAAPTWRTDRATSVAKLESMVLGGITGTSIRYPFLTGGQGCGKSALLRLAARRLQAAGFTILKASGPDIVSGQCYPGDLEKRVRGMLGILEKERFV